MPITSYISRLWPNNNYPNETASIANVRQAPLDAPEEAIDEGWFNINPEDVEALQRLVSHFEREANAPMQGQAGLRSALLERSMNFLRGQAEDHIIDAVAEYLISERSVLLDRGIANTLMNQLYAQSRATDNIAFKALSRRSGMHQKGLDLFEAQVAEVRTGLLQDKAAIASFLKRVLNREFSLQVEGTRETPLDDPNHLFSFQGPNLQTMQEEELLREFAKASIENTLFSLLAKTIHYKLEEQIKKLCKQSLGMSKVSSQLVAALTKHYVGSAGKFQNTLEAVLLRNKVPSSQRIENGQLMWDILENRNHPTSYPRLAMTALLTETVGKERALRFQHQLNQIGEHLTQAKEWAVDRFDLEWEKCPNAREIDTMQYNDALQEAQERERVAALLANQLNEEPVLVTQDDFLPKDDPWCEVNISQEEAAFIEECGRADQEERAPLVETPPSYPVRIASHIANSCLTSLAASAQSQIERAIVDGVIFNQKTNLIDRFAADTLLTGCYKYLTPSDAFTRAATETFGLHEPLHNLLSSGLTEVRQQLNNSQLRQQIAKLLTTQEVVPLEKTALDQGTSLLLDRGDTLSLITEEDVLQNLERAVVEQFIMEQFDDTLQHLLPQLITDLLQQKGYLNGVEGFATEALFIMLVEKNKAALLQAIEQSLFGKEVSSTHRVANGRKLLASLRGVAVEEINPKNEVVKRVTDRTSARLRASVTYVSNAGISAGRGFTSRIASAAARGFRSAKTWVETTLAPFDMDLLE